MGGDDHRRQGHPAALCAAGKGAGLSGRGVGSGSRAGGVAWRRNDLPDARTLCFVADGVQAIWVVGTTFTLWFALVQRYSASKLSAFSFITPLFGVLASYFILHEELTLSFGVAALLVVAGLYLVNRPERARAKVPPDPNI